MTFTEAQKLNESVKDEGARLEGLREYFKQIGEFTIACKMIDAEMAVLDVRQEIVNRIQE